MRLRMSNRGEISGGEMAGLSFGIMEIENWIGGLRIGRRSCAGPAPGGDERSADPAGVAERVAQ